MINNDGMNQAMREAIAQERDFTMLNTLEHAAMRFSFHAGSTLASFAAAAKSMRDGFAGIQLPKR